MPIPERREARVIKADYKTLMTEFLLSEAEIDEERAEQQVKLDLEVLRADERAKVKEWHPKCETCRHWSDGYCFGAIDNLCTSDDGYHPTKPDFYCSAHTTPNPTPTEDKP